MQSTATATPRTTPPSGRGHLATLGLLALALVAIVLFIALVVRAAPDFRGSDQYWYVEDVTTLVEGGPAETHEVYPFSILGEDDRFDEERPFIHDRPVLYVWAVAARLAGDVHTGIVTVNVVCALLGSLFMYLAARRFVGRTGALLAGLTYLYLPASFWLTSQDMSEPFSTMLIALAVYLVARAPTSLPAHLATQASLAFAAADRIWAIGLMALFPLALLLLDEERRLSTRLGRAAAAFAFGIALLVPLSMVFRSYFPGLDPMAMLEVSRSGNNMVMFFRYGPPPFELGTFLRELARNTVDAVRIQFTLTERVFPMTPWLPGADRWPVTLLAFASASGLAVRGVDRTRRLLMGLGGLGLVLHLIAAGLYQNQPRYQLVFVPVIVLGAAVAAHTWWEAAGPKGTLRLLVPVLAVAFLLVSGYVDQRNVTDLRASSEQAAEARAVAAEVVDGAVPAGARVAMDTEFMRRWVWDHALYPRPVLALATEAPYDEEEYATLFAAFEPEYLLVDEGSLLPRLYDVRLVDSHESYSIYELVE